MGQVTLFGNPSVNGGNESEAADPDLVVCVRFPRGRDQQQSSRFRPTSVIGVYGAKVRRGLQARRLFPSTARNGEAFEHPLPSANTRPHVVGQGMIGTVLIALAGEPLMIFELMAR
jgi:hypothetical protein